jgi:hypothetical protein
MQTLMLSMEIIPVFKYAVGIWLSAVSYQEEPTPAKFSS